VVGLTLMIPNVLAAAAAASAGAYTRYFLAGREHFSWDT